MNEPTDGIIHRLQHSEPPGWPDLEMMEAAQGASCMVCGHIAPFGVWNAENPKIGVCVTCRERAQEDPLREQVARLEKALNDAVERAHRASQEVERLTQACEKEFSSVEELNGECLRLRQQIAELERDRERLEWLNANYNFRASSDSHGVTLEVDGESFTENTLAQAIDAAMQANPAP